MKVDKAKRLKAGEKEKARHRKLIADLSPDYVILKVISRGNF